MTSPADAIRDMKNLMADFSTEVAASIADSLYGYLGGADAIRKLTSKFGIDFPSEADIEKFTQEYNKVLDELNSLTAPEVVEVRSVIGKNPGGSAYWNEVKHNAGIAAQNADKSRKYLAEGDRLSSAAKQAKDNLDEAERERKPWEQPFKTVKTEAKKIITGSE